MVADATNGHKEEPVDPPVPLDITGNWRITNAIDDHNVTYMRVNFPVSQKGRYQTVTAVVVILLVISLIIGVVLGICALRMKKGLKEEADVMAEGGRAYYDTAVRNNRQVGPAE